MCETEFLELEEQTKEKEKESIKSIKVSAEVCRRVTENVEIHGCR